MTFLAQALAGHWLVVDDQEICRIAAARLLSDLGATCDFASDGLEALNALETFPYFGLLIDVSMPNMSGNEAVARIREKEAVLRRAPLPIIMITGEPGAAARNSGQFVDLIIEKPINTHPNSLLLAFAELSVRRSLASLIPKASGKFGLFNVQPLLAGVRSLASSVRALFGNRAHMNVPVREALVIKESGQPDPSLSPMAQLLRKPAALAIRKLNFRPLPNCSWTRPRASAWRSNVMVSSCRSYEPLAPASA